LKTIPFSLQNMRLPRVGILGRTWSPFATLLLALAPLLSGCVIQFELTGDHGQSGQDEGVTLPPPKAPGGGGTTTPSEPETPLSDAEQARQDEVDKYIRTVIYQGGTIVDSYVLPSGDVVDFIDKNTLPAVDLPELPITLDLTVPPGVELGLSEIEQIPELLALAQTAAPFTRPSFWSYVLGETDATSIEDYLERYTVGGAPSPDGGQRLYAGYNVNFDNRGISGVMNQFRPQVEKGSFSLIEFAIACPAAQTGVVSTDVIGVVISVDKTNPFGRNKQALTDNEARLHVEYAATNPNTGKLEYHWDHLDGKFIRNPAALRSVNTKVDVSEIGGKQVEHPFAIFQSLTGDWWIAYHGELLGYYPGDLFTNMNGLNGHACRASWYGEVLRPSPTAPEPATEMGSGKFADSGYKNAAYVRNPMVYDTLWVGVTPEQVEAAVPKSLEQFHEEILCYASTEFDTSPLGDRRFFLGGPGITNNNAACVWP